MGSKLNDPYSDVGHGGHVSDEICPDREKIDGFELSIIMYTCISEKHILSVMRLL
jgi:hypothetical protein